MFISTFTSAMFVNMKDAPRKNYFDGPFFSIEEMIRNSRTSFIHIADLWMNKSKILWKKAKDQKKQLSPSFVLKTSRQHFYIECQSGK